MPLLNYTTTVDATRTVQQVMGMLQRRHATSILMHFDAAQRCDALCFRIPSPQGELPIKLPVNAQAVFEVLRRGAVPPRFQTLDHAHRVAWRILKDWVEAQLAILETQMVSMEQVFMPYILGPDDRTLFETLRDRHFLLTEGKP